MKRLLSLLAMTLLAVAAAAQTATIPQGTALRVKMDKPLSTWGSHPGEEFTGTLTQPVVVEGKTILPTGTTVQSRVTSVSEPRRIHGKPTIGIRPEDIIMPGGDKLMIDATLVDTSLRDGSSVNSEGQFKGPGHTKADMIIIGGGAGTGALIGGLAGGGVGLAVGSGVGAAAGTARWLVRHHEASIPVGTELFIQLNRPVTVNVPQTTAGQ